MPIRKRPPRIKSRLSLFNKRSLSRRVKRDLKEAKKKGGTGIAYMLTEGIFITAFVIEEINKFFAVRDARLINRVVRAEYSKGKKKRGTVEGLINALDMYIRNERTAADGKINELRQQINHSATVLTSIGASASGAKKDLKTGTESKKATAEAAICRIKDDRDQKIKAALMNQKAIIDQKIEPYFGQYYNYIILRIDYYLKKAGLNPPPTNQPLPTKYGEELLRAVRADQCLLGRYEKKRREIEAQMKKLDGEGFSAIPRRKFRRKGTGKNGKKP